jgi:hypothetical protein
MTPRAQMNEVAEEPFSLLTGASQTANVSKCWNWFEEANSDATVASLP